MFVVSKKIFFLHQNSFFWHLWLLGARRADGCDGLVLWGGGGNLTRRGRDQDTSGVARTYFRLKCFCSLKKVRPETAVTAVAAADDIPPRKHYSM